MKNLTRFHIVATALTLVLVSASVALAGAPYDDPTGGPRDGTDLVVPKRSVQGEIDGGVTTPPVGVADEYFTSESFTNSMGSFQIQTYRNPMTGDEEIQLLITVIDGTDNMGNDLIRVYFDINHSHLDPTAVGALYKEIEITRDASAVYGNANIGATPFSPVALPSGQWEVVDNGADWVAEVKILPGDLDLNGIPDLMGFYIQVIDGLNEGHYPSSAVADADVADWANLETRYPIDYMIVLDYSGSMLSENKWDNAKQAADFFVNTMAILGDASDFDDRIGLVTFHWPCFGAADATNTEEALASIGTFPKGEYTSGIADPAGSNCTPIGAGLLEAFVGAMNLDATQDDETTEKERGVLLLSDGLQNRPSATIVPADTGYDPCPGTLLDWEACPADTESNVPVSTVAFGEGDWSVDTDLLQDIQIRYQGSLATTYTLSTDVEDLKEAFINSLEEFYTTNLSTVDTAAPYTFSITSGNDKLIAIASWTTASQAEEITLELGGGPVSCDQSDEDTDVGFAICVVENPVGGNWEALAFDGTFNNNPDRLFAVVDLRLRARFGINPVRIGTGDDILLTAELKDRGRPVLHHPTDHPVTVTVRIETPEQAVGTFASTHEPRTCETIRPQPPFRSRQTPGRIDPTGGAGPGVAVSGDPDPPLYSLMNQLLEACQLDGLLRTQQPGLDMRDDGTQGDQVDNDGIYSRRFTNTDTEGTYVFRFNVEGTTADGESFTRTKRVAKYVRVNVDPQISEVGSQVLQQSGNIVTVGYYVLPRDAFGGYLGPGKARHVDFVVTAGAGTFTSEVLDFINGYYGRQLQYDSSQGEPEVTVVVHGNPLERPGSRNRFEFGLFAGLTVFDDALLLDDGPVVGARLGYRIAPPVVLEAEGAVTFTDNAAGVSGRVIQLLGNGRFEFNPRGPIVPFITGGAGYALFRGFGTNDEALALQGGAGLNLRLNRRVGLRGDVRVISIGDVFGLGATTNFQVTGGLVVRFGRSTP